MTEKICGWDLSMKQWISMLTLFLALAMPAAAQNSNISPVDPPGFGTPVDPIEAYRESITLASNTVRDVSLAADCNLISRQDGEIMDAKVTANVRTIPSSFSFQTWPNGQPMFTSLPDSEIARASAVLQQASNNGAEESKDPKNCNDLVSSQARMEVLNLLANSADIVSLAQEPVAPSGFGASLPAYGAYISTAFAAAACGYRPSSWAQTLLQKINLSVLVQAKDQNATVKQRNEALYYFNEEMKFGQRFTAYGCSLVASDDLTALDGIEALPP